MQNGDTLSDAFHVSERMRRMPTEVAINVEQQVQMEQLEEVDFKQLRKSRRIEKSAKIASESDDLGYD